MGNIIHGAAGIHRFRAVIKGESAPSIKQAQGKSALLAGADMAMKASSMPLEKGQLVNISNITAGVQDKDGRPLFNVVPDSAEVDVEVRGRTTEEADALRKNIYAVFEETAKAHGVTIDMACDTMVGFQLASNAPVVAFAEAATRAAGFKPRTITMMGGSDANYMNDKGLPTVIIGSGAFNQHTEREYTTRNALVSTSRVVMSLIATAANPAIAAAFATAGQTPPEKALRGQ